ncbi:type III secretion protein SctE [Burkholderia lata]|uniref:type III secretion protein n=1 Tax=Burkholderia lata (strain ATCC 17760 / DSM 23089 / LMG 22485 / NCIMB 9086 / R18194 / 383) TaxID=482957 RepID=UPI001452B546|nr:type III secretion protein [Burkholderia lata]VWD52951.1 type III secretion protein SctE [Burkholderia lata]
MYEKLEAISAQFNDLPSYLDHSSGSVRDDLLCKALDSTAHECLAANAQTDLDRQNLANLHHGFMAANRIVQHLLETVAIERT